MRIVGGQFRGRSIIVPKSDETRPTMDRTREAVFNSLENAPWAKGEDGTSILRGATVLDVFAGSGAYGIEALSRGAEYVTFFEHSAEAIKAIDDNVIKLDVKEKTKTMRGNVLTVPAARYQLPHVAFFDPPYGKDLITQSIKALKKRGWLSSKTLLVIETESKKSDELPNSFEILSERTYGRSKVVIGRLS